jgi:tyrosyl-tRNA synthetase
LSRFFDLSSHERALMLNNSDWLVKLNLVDSLCDIGKHFSVNEMIKRDSVRVRLEEREQGISYTEFSYMLLQAYDFLYLCQHFDCTIQMGGSDQWGNILSGKDL